MYWTILAYHEYSKKSTFTIESLQKSSLLLLIDKLLERLEKIRDVKKIFYLNKIIDKLLKRRKKVDVNKIFYLNKIIAVAKI